MKNVIIEQKSENPRYSIEARSYIGGRIDQQDYAYIHIDTQDILAVVCDGMGGAVDGAIASNTAILSIKDAYKTYRKTGDKDPISFLYHAMNIADRDVSEKLEYKSGGTTMVSIIIRDGLLYWLSVGDSRLYILRSGELLQVTRDHNYFLRLDELKERGEISPDLYNKESARGDALISYIGMGNITLFDLTQVGLELQHGDQLLLATDGLFKNILPATLQDLLETEIDISSKANLLMEEASRTKKTKVQDNTTYIIIDVL